MKTIKLIIDVDGAQKEILTAGFNEEVFKKVSQVSGLNRWEEISKVIGSVVIEEIRNWNSMNDPYPDNSGLRKMFENQDNS